MEGYPEALLLSPLDWPEQSGDPRPGALDLFAPQGFGLGAPPIIMPYGGPPQSSYYGFDAPHAHPFLNAPATESRGGTLYFDDNAEPESLAAALRLMGLLDTEGICGFCSQQRRSAGRALSRPTADRFKLGSRLAIRRCVSQAPAGPGARYRRGLDRLRRCTESQMERPMGLQRKTRRNGRRRRRLGQGIARLRLPCRELLLGRLPQSGAGPRW